MTPFISSLARRLCFGKVGLSVCLSVCLFKDITQKRYEHTGVQFYGGVLGSTMKN